jgi:hypothetical protein
MPRHGWVALTVCVCWLLRGAVWAQEAALPLPADTTAGKIEARPTEVVVVSPHADGPAPEEAIFSANLLLGYETGVRVEAAFSRQENLSFVAEAFYGAILSRMGSSEGAGGGVRAFFRRSSRYSTNSLLLGPGLDVLAQFHNNGLIMVAPTLDLSWLHGFDGGAGWETGMNVGIGVGVASDMNNGDKHVGEVTPLISFYTGLRY